MRKEKKWSYAEGKEWKVPLSEGEITKLVKSGGIAVWTLVWTKGFEK
jgi:hypothetical protein